jgi:hypothetical protein
LAVLAAGRLCLQIQRKGRQKCKKCNGEVTTCPLGFLLTGYIGAAIVAKFSDNATELDDFRRKLREAGPSEVGESIDKPWKVVLASLTGTKLGTGRSFEGGRTQQNPGDL